MSFWKSLERNVFRPAGRGLKAAAPVIGGVAGSFIPGIGTIAGSALGSAIGGQVKKGKFDAGALLKDAGMGVLTGGVMSKLGGGSFLGGAAKANPVDALKPMDWKGQITGQLARGPGNGVGGATMDGIMRQGGGMAQAAAPWWKQGQNIKALGETGAAALGAYQENRMTNAQLANMKRQQMLEDEDRAREQAMDPARAALLQSIFARLGIGQGGMA